MNILQYDLKTGKQTVRGYTPEEQAAIDARAAIEAEEAPAKAVALVKAEAQRRILARYPIWKQINAALGVYDATTVAAMTTYINAVRLASDAIEARLAADPSLDLANAPEWPEIA